MSAATSAVPVSSLFFRGNPPAAVVTPVAEEVDVVTSLSPASTIPPVCKTTKKLDKLT